MSKENSKDNIWFRKKENIETSTFGLPPILNYYLAYPPRVHMDIALIVPINNISYKVEIKANKTEREREKGMESIRVCNISF
jgi:hypothetical protein